MLEDYTWKKEKSFVGKELHQESIKMIDMTDDELKSAYLHCKNMLYNDQRSSPGRYLVLKEIEQQIVYCNVELAVRWFCQIHGENDVLVYTRFSLINEISEYLQKLGDNVDPKNVKLCNIYDGLPIDYKNINVDLFLKACKDTLGKLNRSHITQTFIINLGIWFSQEEIRNFTEIEKRTTLDERLQAVKERLTLKSDTKIPVKSTGLNYTQFRSMISLKANKKYTELTTNQLEVLRDKVLFALEENVNYHISQWETLMSQLEEVAENKKIKLQ